MSHKSEAEPKANKREGNQRWFTTPSLHRVFERENAENSRGLQIIRNLFREGGVFFPWVKGGKNIGEARPNSSFWEKSYIFFHIRLISFKGGIEETK